MPSIRPSLDLKNKYSKISEFCNNNNEPVFITKNGKEDLAVMSIESYEKLVGKTELHQLINEGMDAYNNKNVRLFNKALDDLKKDL